MSIFVPIVGILCGLATGKYEADLRGLPYPAGTFAARPLGCTTVVSVIWQEAQTPTVILKVVYEFEACSSVNLRYNEIGLNVFIIDPASQNNLDAFIASVKAMHCDCKAADGDLRRLVYYEDADEMTAVYSSLLLVLDHA